MFTGDKLKRVRTFRKMTQKQLGLALGYDESSADVRIAQYEADKRTPKEDTIQTMANILNVNTLALRGSITPYCAEDILSTLFEMDEEMPIELVGVNKEDESKENVAIMIDYSIMQGFLEEWKLRKQEVTDGSITDKEYQEWKLNWPDSADDCGKFEATHQWRNKQ